MLDEIDKKILFELDLNCRSSSIDISKKLNIARQTVDYRTNKLVEMGVIENFHACFSLSKLGYRIHKIYFKLRNLPERKAELREFIYGLGNVYWLGESSGSWDMLVGLFYKDEAELFPITNALNSKFNDLIVESSGAQTVRIYQFPKMFLSSEHHSHKVYIGEVKNTEVEELDLRIIAELVQDARCPITRLGEKLNTSPQIIKRRIIKLEQLGIIFQYRIEINLKKTGWQLYKSIIRLNEYTAQDHERFFAFISKVRALQYFIRNLWTIELELNVRDYDEYEKIIADIRKEFPNLIGSIDSLLLETDEWTTGFRNLLTK